MTKTRNDRLAQAWTDNRLAVLQLLNVEEALAKARIVHVVRQGAHLKRAIEAVEKAQRLLRSLKREAKSLK